MRGLCVLMIKSGLLFLYTSLDDVCSHWNWPSFACSRYAMSPEAPVLSTATNEASF